MITEILLTDYKKLSSLDSTCKAADILKTESFVVVIENDKFYGLLTTDDLIYNRKILIGDTVKQKPLLKRTDSIKDGIIKIIESRVEALPCVEKDCCIGVLTREKAFETMFKKSSNEKSSVNIKNIIENINDETIKEEFLKKICHYTKNHLQILFSGFNLLEDSNLDTEQKDIIGSMYKATTKMDLVISNFLKEYFSNEMIKETETPVVF